MERRLAVMVVALAACASTTKLTNVQVAPETTPRPKFRNMLVVGIVKDPATREAYETEMVKALQLAGVQAASSQALLPIGEAPKREVLEHLVAEKGFDGALVGRLIDSRTEVNAVPPVYGFYGYYGWAAPIAYSPGYLETTQTVVVETRAFRTASESAAVFSATSDSVDPYSVKSACQSISKLVVEELRKSGFI